MLVKGLAPPGSGLSTAELQCSCMEVAVSLHLDFMISFGVMVLEQVSDIGELGS